jgi:hypothetical protein
MIQWQGLLFPVKDPNATLLHTTLGYDRTRIRLVTFFCQQEKCQLVCVPFHALILKPHGLALGSYVCQLASPPTAFTDSVRCHRWGQKQEGGWKLVGWSWDPWSHFARIYLIVVVITAFSQNLSQHQAIWSSEDSMFPLSLRSGFVQGQTAPMPAGSHHPPLYPSQCIKLLYSNCAV